MPGTVIRGCPACLLDHLEHVLIIQGEWPLWAHQGNYNTPICECPSYMSVCVIVCVDIDGVAYIESWKQAKGVNREYWMIYTGPGFLAFVWFGSPHTLPPSLVCKLPLFLSLGETAYWRGEEWGGRGANSYDGEKAWSSINNSKLSDIRR